MPVVVLTAAHLADETAELRAAATLTSCLAGSLDLAPEDIYLTWTVPHLSVLGATAVQTRPVILIHGRNRPGTAAAMGAAGRAAADIWNLPQADVWVQWLTPQPLG